MRLRSNHVLPDPNQAPPPPRRRRQTRASSAQPTEPATATARGPAKKVTKNTRGKKNARKAKTPSPEPEILSTAASPVPHLVVSQDHSPLAATPAVQPTDDRELDSSIRPQDPQFAPQDTPVTPQDFPEMPETLLGASLFTIEEEEEPFSPFQQRAQQRNEERIQAARILEQVRLQRRILVCLAEERRLQERIHPSQTSPIPLDEPQHPSPSSLEDDDEFVDACEVIDRNSKSAKSWLLRKKLFGGGPLRVLEPLSPFSEDRKYRIMNNMDLPDPPGIWTKIKETQGLTYYQDRWGIKRVYQPDQPESSPAKRQKSSTASPAILSSPRPRGASRKTYADRTRRRQIEANGRIDRTIFRLPELLAQQRADAAANTARLSPNSDDTIPPMTPPPTAPAPAAAAAATQPNTSWRRWIYSSLDQPVGRNPAEEAAEQPIVEEPQTPHAQQNISSDPPASAPSAYYAARSRQDNPDTVTPQQAGNPRVRRRTQARPYYPSRRYDLYPRGFDEALLDRCFAGSTAPGHRKVPAPPEQKQSHENEIDSSNKRKRQPSPDVIPNPPGCSYGLHDDYFTYDDDDEAWAAEEQARRDAAKTSPDSKKPATKKARANFNHAGHFEVPYSSGSEGPTPVKQPVVKNFNQSGHFEAPYISGSEGPTPVKQPVVKNFNQTGHFEVPESSGSEASSSDTGKSSGPKAQARRTAEQHKPKTPSRLRAAHRFSLDPAIMDNLDKMMESDDPSERARAATVLQACPTGDLRSVKWPKTKSWVDKIDMVWEDIHTRDRYWRNRMAAGGLDRDKEMQYRVHKQFQESVAILAKARRDGRCALV
ncbi:hypothetical protein N7499_010098 [Penicillium canescens]|nr:hypothetical protein N7499_010098 [Penicillium canescens]